jgi:hypothetical protein
LILPDNILSEPVLVIDPLTNNDPVMTAFPLNGNVAILEVVKIFPVAVSNTNTLFGLVVLDILTKLTLDAVIAPFVTVILPDNILSDPVVISDPLIIALPVYGNVAAVGAKDALSA